MKNYKKLTTYSKGIACQRRCHSFKLHWHNGPCAGLYCAKAKQYDYIQICQTCERLSDRTELFPSLFLSPSTNKKKWTTKAWFVIGLNVWFYAVINQIYHFILKINCISAVCWWHTNKRMHDRTHRLHLECIDKEQNKTKQKRGKQQHIRVYNIWIYYYDQDVVVSEFKHILNSSLACLFVRSLSARSETHSLAHTYSYFEKTLHIHSRTYYIILNTHIYKNIAQPHTIHNCHMRYSIQWGIGFYRIARKLQSETFDSKNHKTSHNHYQFTHTLDIVY